MSDEKKQLSKARQSLVDRVLSRLDAGAMPWDNGMQGIVVKPYNAISGKPYSGMNVLNLMLAFKQDPRWLTFNQASDAGYAVKKGAKGVPIEIYKIIDKRTGKDADLAAIKEEVKDMSFEERQAFKKENLQTFARSYYVFNASDVAGIEPYRAPELTPTDISARNERIERVIANSQAPIFYDGNGRNYYSQVSDDIHLTERAAFKSDEYFYNTALHEMAHSTGHSSRLNRNMGSGFGSQSYAREELVAEISSVLTAAELGLNHSDRVIENSAEYIRSWAKLIRDNPQTLIDATFDASRATDYICGSERQREQAQEKTQKESLQSYVKEWYLRTYPTDELASELNASATFGSVRDAIMSGKDIYAELGSDDSVVRERVFGKLADVLDLSYKSVYNAWIENSESAETRKERYERAMREDFPKDFADDYAERRPPRTTVPADFKGRVDSVLAGTYPSGEVVPVGDTPKLIQDIGFAPRIMAMKQGHLRDLLKPERRGNGGNQHGLSRDFIYSIPEHIGAPAMVFRSLTRPNDSIVIVTNKTDSKNNPIIIALAADQPGMLNRKDTRCNLIASAYGRTEFSGFIQRNCDANSIIYYDKKKSQDLADSIRVEFPQALTSLNSNVILQHFEPNVNSLEQKTQKEKVQPAKQQTMPTSTFKTNLENIPDAMKALPNWVAFRTRTVFDEKDQKYKLKKTMLTPNQPRPVSSSEYLKWASHSDPSTWATFDKAVAFAKKYKLEGLSFAMGGSGMTCVDLDHHLETGSPTDFAQKFIDAAGTTYVEKSVSGTGLHIFFAGQMPQGIKNVDKELDLEVYDKQRFISMTGNLYCSATKEVLPPTEAMTNLLKANLHQEQNTAKLESKPLGLSDNELIDRIRASSCGRDFEAMWRGEDICGNRNVTDMKLCGMLAFYSNGDVAQVERCFKASGLYRPPPQKSAGYVHLTAQKACDGRRAEYDPKAYAQRMNPNRQSVNKRGGNGSGGNSGR